jgi:DNA (cytosine-5)-methyltransferase 1
MDRAANAGLKRGYTPYTMPDVRRSMAQARFTFASGFAGAGGACMGYALAGGHPIFAIELDPEAARTYRRNFPHTWVEQRDFREVAASLETIDRLLRQGGLARGQIDFFHASPPCNEFARLGPGPQEGGTADLIFDVVRMTKIVRPRVLIIENVPDLGGPYRYILDAALQSLCFDETGRRLYYANSDKLMASHYGVPQRRLRLFVIAVRVDVAKAVGINSDDGVSELFPAATHKEVSFREAVTGLPQTELDYHPYRRAMMTSNLAHVVRRLRSDPKKWFRPIHAGMGKYRYTTARASWDLPIPTVTASGAQPDGRSGIIHPTLPRKLTIRETMRATAWPDDFVFTGTVAQAAIRLGMSVPPLMTKVIAEVVLERVLNPYRVNIGEAFHQISEETNHANVSIKPVGNDTATG